VVLEQFVLHGVTTILDVGGQAGTDRQIAELKRRERAAEIVAPRIFATGSLLTVPGGHPVPSVPEDTSRETWAAMGVRIVT
jgi:hypothetical protein